MERTLPITVFEHGPISLVDYASVSAAFEVTTVVDVDESVSSAGFVLSERPLKRSYRKDYDALAGEGPSQWVQRFDLSRWALFGACVNEQRVGAAAVAFEAFDSDLFDQRSDLAVLWDIRVSSVARGCGVGAALFRAAEARARAQGCRTLKLETQNTNAPACRLYAREGCVLRTIRRSAYRELPDEVQMFWYKEL